MVVPDILPMWSSSNASGFTLGTYNATVKTAQDGYRWFQFHVPRNYVIAQKTPLFFMFHSAWLEPNCSLFNAGHFVHSEEAGYIAVAGKSITNNWNTRQSEQGDDVRFFKDMLLWFKKRTSVDENAVLVHGYSRGGFMAYKLACEASEHITIVGVVAGGLPTADYVCNKQKRPVSIVHFHGEEDTNVSPVYGLRGMQTYRSNPTMQCTGPYLKAYERGNFTCRWYNKCNGNAVVRYCTVKGMWHAWLGAGKYADPGAPPRCGADTPDDSIDATKHLLFCLRNTFVAWTTRHCKSRDRQWTTLSV